MIQDEEMNDLMPGADEMAKKRAVYEKSLMEHIFRQKEMAKRAGRKSGKKFKAPNTSAQLRAKLTLFHQQTRNVTAPNDYHSLAWVRSIQPVNGSGSHTGIYGF